MRRLGIPTVTDRVVQAGFAATTGRSALLACDRYSTACSSAPLLANIALSVLV
jgi:retron-type reverse transcriptase